jgi:RNA polymerase sigma-70 factor (ECF subfamily)
MEEGQRDFQEIYVEYYPKIVGYVRRLVGGLDAEDAAQEVFVKISQALDRFRGESSLATWIYRIATNTALDHVRKASSHKTIQLPEEDLVPSGTDSIPRDNEPRLDTVLIRKDMNECIRGLVNELPENYRTVLVLSDLEGFTNAEIGDILGISLDTVKIRLHRARLALRKSMDRTCELYHDERNELSCDRKPAVLDFLKK